MENIPIGGYQSMKQPLNYSYCASRSFTCEASRRPCTFSPIITTGAKPQAPTQRRQSSENLPSGVTSPTLMPNSF